MLKEILTISGHLKIEVFDEDMKLKSSTLEKNMVTLLGRSLVMSRLLSNTDPVLTHMGVGTSSVAVTSSDTSLGVQLGARSTFDSVVHAANQVTFIATFGPGPIFGAISEAGLFNGATGSNIFARTVFSPRNKADVDTMIITWVSVIN